MPTTADVIAEARKYLGVRWVHQGRAAVGIDCAGLLIRVHQGLGLPVADRKGYRRSSDSIEFLEHIRQQTSAGLEPVPGAIGMFAESTFACHTGIFSEKHGVLHLIHAKMSAGKVIEEPFIGALVSQLIEVRHINGLED
jgi:hypothetical protein